jgi:hypothetical protein
VDKIRRLFFSHNNSIILFILVSAWNVLCLASVNALEFESGSIEKFSTQHGDLRELRVVLREKARATGVCEYVTDKIDFDQKRFYLNIKMSKGFCPNDKFGKSYGAFTWVLPRSLERMQKKICVAVNGEELGFISLGIERNQNEYPQSQQIWLGGCKEAEQINEAAGPEVLFEER